jgi:hypothetical protein
MGTSTMPSSKSLCGFFGLKRLIFESQTQYHLKKNDYLGRSNRPTVINRSQACDGMD